MREHDQDRILARTKAVDINTGVCCCLNALRPLFIEAVHIIINKENQIVLPVQLIKFRPHVSYVAVTDLLRCADQ